MPHLLNGCSFANCVSEPAGRMRSMFRVEKIIARLRASTQQDDVLDGIFVKFQSPAIASRRTMVRTNYTPNTVQ
jgi:hypothetical protein